MKINLSKILITNKFSSINPYRYKKLVANGSVIREEIFKNFKDEDMVKPEILAAAKEAINGIKGNIPIHEKEIILLNIVFKNPKEFISVISQNGVTLNQIYEINRIISEREYEEIAHISKHIDLRGLSEFYNQTGDFSIIINKIMEMAHYQMNLLQKKLPVTNNKYDELKIYNDEYECENNKKLIKMPK